MAKFSRNFPATNIGIPLESGKSYVDYKDIEELRRVLSANGKMHSRQRTRLASQEQRKAALAIKRARYMALLPYNTHTR